jgi:hypothetical protein
MSDDAERIWWETTWRERENAIQEAFGPSHPVDAPQGYVNSPDLMESGLPGACVYTFRPFAETHGSRELRDYWMYVTHGLTQFLSRSDMAAERAKGNRLSRSGFEFAMLFDEPVYWVTGLLRWMMSYSQGPTPLGVSHRVPFQFHSLEPKDVRWAIGVPDEGDPPQVGATRAIIFWRYLSPFSSFTTSTGAFTIRVGTTISGEEWELAKAQTSAHLLLLLQWAGIGQRSIPNRPSVTDRDGWQDAWGEIRSLTELQAGERLQGLSTAGSRHT